MDEGYSSFQNSSASDTPLSSSNPQISPDSTNNSPQETSTSNPQWKYSPEFLASVQTAMKIFQQQMQGSNSSEMPSPFSRWNTSPLATPLSGRVPLLPPIDSEIIIQRLLTQLRSNMLRMVDNSLAQIECSLRSQEIDRDSLLGYLGQATAINLQQCQTSPTNFGSMFGRRDFFSLRKNPLERFDSESQLNFDDSSSQITSNSFELGSKSQNENLLENLNPAGSSLHIADKLAMNMSMNSILTTAHLKKAKLMFLYVRYPNSALLKSFFPGVRFNRSNTAQLIKWFSNFREFLYINVEKYVRQLISEGMPAPNVEDVMNPQHELVRVLLMHYNRGREIDVEESLMFLLFQTPTEFHSMVQKTVQEFFRAIQSGEDEKASWKKPIYKVIAQMDQPLPDYFKQ
ncbi:hypothetical protein Ciccas_008581 [Cichlidogyrus casuarinus]|uniref:Prospero domain-containing protein n=1 Tax=Cichlidogyrus casuarinus TaxID=1844966 RepID=A0ABD2Q130_9PLAT